MEYICSDKVKNLTKIGKKETNLGEAINDRLTKLIEITEELKAYIEDTLENMPENELINKFFIAPLGGMIDVGLTKEEVFQYELREKCLSELSFAPLAKDVNKSVSLTTRLCKIIQNKVDVAYLTESTGDIKMLCLQKDMLEWSLAIFERQKQLCDKLIELTATDEKAL